MNITDFCAACEWLFGDGMTIKQARYDGDAFGSWFIDVPSNGKLRRGVWDGRDGWLIIQSQSADDGWKDEWIAREPDEQTVEQLVRRLKG